MKLWEALEKSNCGKVTDDCNCVYTVGNINEIRFVDASRDYWQPVILKKKVKTIRYMNMYVDGECTIATTKEEADRWGHGRIRCVELTGEYEE